MNLKNSSHGSTILNHHQFPVNRLSTFVKEPFNECYPPKIPINDQVQAYQSRSTNLPSEIVSTALLTQALLLPPSSPPLVFRTSMTLALIRFVNSLLDPLQKRDKSLPLSILAAGANLPTVFVEVRHWGTHESNLPGTEVLRDMGIRALEWLWRNYWNKKDDSIDVIAAWKHGSVDTNDVVAALRDHQDASFGSLLEGLSEDDDFAASQKSWEPLLSSLLKDRLPFPKLSLTILSRLLSLHLLVKF